MCIRDSDYTGKKLADINLLFNDYESQIKDRYTDSEDRIDLYLGKIRESELIRGNQIWVYGFDSFAPKTMALLGELMSSADEVNLLLTWDDSRPDADLFELTGIVMHNAVCQAQARSCLLYTSGAYAIMCSMPSIMKKRPRS